MWFELHEMIKYNYKKVNLVRKHFFFNINMCRNWKWVSSTHFFMYKQVSTYISQALDFIPYKAHTMTYILKLNFKKIYGLFCPTLSQSGLRLHCGCIISFKNHLNKQRYIILSKDFLSLKLHIWTKYRKTRTSQINLNTSIKVLLAVHSNKSTFIIYNIWLETYDIIPHMSTIFAGFCINVTQWNCISLTHIGTILSWPIYAQYQWS